MGASIAKAASNSMEQVAVDVTNEFFTTCSNNVSSSDTFKFGKGCKTGNIKASIKNKTTISQKCLTQGTVKNSLNQTMKSRLEQQAQSLSQNLGFPSLSYTNSLIEISQSIADTITNNIATRCLTNNNNTVKFDCEGANIGDVVFTIENQADIINSCVTNAASYNSLKNSMEQVLRNSSTAKEADALGSLLIFLGLFAIGVLFFIYEEINSPVGYLVIFVIIAILVGSCIYSYSAAGSGLYPYQREF